MQRDIENELMRWKAQNERLPLLVRGARQVGKSYVIEEFGRKAFDNLVVVNFELHPELKQCFRTLEPDDIISHLQLLIGAKIEPEKTLLFLDEIQECPSAIMALRCFKEKKAVSQLSALGPSWNLPCKARTSRCLWAESNFSISRLFHLLSSCQRQTMNSCGSTFVR